LILMHALADVRGDSPMWTSHRRDSSMFRLLGFRTAWASMKRVGGPAHAFPCSPSHCRKVGPTFFLGHSNRSYCTLDARYHDGKPVSFITGCPLSIMIYTYATVCLAQCIRDQPPHGEHVVGRFEFKQSVDDVSACNSLRVWINLTQGLPARNNYWAQQSY
jgi:hypothetical protein